MEYLTEEHYAIAAENGIKRETAYARFYVYDWGLKKTITHPIAKGVHTNTGKWARIAEANGINRATFHSRVKYGWDLEKAATKETRKLREKESK